MQDTCGGFAKPIAASAAFAASCVLHTYAYRAHAFLTSKQQLHQVRLHLITAPRVRSCRSQPCLVLDSKCCCYKRGPYQLTNVQVSCMNSLCGGKVSHWPKQGVCDSVQPPLRCDVLQNFRPILTGNLQRHSRLSVPHRKKTNLQLGRLDAINSSHTKHELGNNQLVTPHTSLRLGPHIGKLLQRHEFESALRVGTGWPQSAEWHPDLLKCIITSGSTKQLNCDCCLQSKRSGVSDLSCAASLWAHGCACCACCFALYCYPVLALLAMACQHHTIMTLLSPRY